MKSMSPKVSVIIPVYNTAPYLYESIGSIMNQSLKEIEIIVVNDGSTDNSNQIISVLAESDCRIKVVQQENIGLSGARNTGILYAKGKYIYFMDSDDSLAINSLESCYEFCEKYDLDFVIFDAENVYEHNVRYKMQDYSRKHVIDEKIIYKGTDFLIEQINNKAFRPSACLIFVRSTFMSLHFKGFYQGIIHEDHLYTVPLHLFAEKAGYIAEPFFKRRVRNNSIMTQNFSMKNIHGYLVTSDELMKLTVSRPDFRVIIQMYLKQMLNAVTWESHKLKFWDKCSFFLSLLKKDYLKYISFKNIIVMFLKSNNG